MLAMLGRRLVAGTAHPCWLACTRHVTATPTDGAFGDLREWMDSPKPNEVAFGKFLRMAHPGHATTS